MFCINLLKINIGLDEKNSRPGGITNELQELQDVFTEGEPDGVIRPSVLGRRSYIDDILTPARSWSSLYENVERLLEFCDKWNLLISFT